MRTQARVDLDAVRDNVRALAAAAPGAAVMAVVKADGYGHGMVPCARAALRGGATWLGVAFPEEALALRAAGLRAPVLAWLFAPQDDLVAPVAQDVDLAAYTPEEVARAAAAAAAAGRPARLHLKADTGLSRGGAGRAEWPDLCEAAAKAEADGTVRVVGVWSHLAHADAPGHPTTARQVAAFHDAVEQAAAAGLRPEVRHLASSGAVLTAPETHLDLVRPGVAVYGLSPVGPPADHGLRPAMTLLSSVVQVKRLPPGARVGYGQRWGTPDGTTTALVPLGYADGVPRAGEGRLEVLVAGRRRPLVGAVSMDQVVADLGSDVAAVGDEVVLFGPGDRGEPTAAEWAQALGTIDYEVVTRIGPRVPRTYTGDGTGEGTGDGPGDGGQP